MLKKSAILFTLITACFMLTACSSSNDANNTTVKETAVSIPETNVETIVEESSVDSSRKDIFTLIIEAEHIELDDAYNQLNGIEYLSEDENALFQKLSLLKNCSGRFVQESENTGNRYTADVAFYLADGEIYCTIDYTGYMGEISDGLVSESQQDGYSFESFPKGDLYGKEQDFKILFSNENLYISWGKVCEYTLTRGDGSAENAQERHETFEETGVMSAITDTVDNALGDHPHSVIYDKDSSSIIISVQIDGLLNAFPSNDPEFLSRWQSLVDLMVSLDEQIYNAAIIPQYYENGLWLPYVYDVHLYIVDKLNTNGEYREDEMLLWVDNGIVKYNIADITSD